MNMRTNGHITLRAVLLAAPLLLAACGGGGHTHTAAVASAG
jgi:hypothetical protein